MRIEIFKGRRLKISAAIIVVLPAIYTLFGFFVVPWIITARVLPRVSEKIDRSLTADVVKFNPFTLSLRVGNFLLAERGGEPLIGFEHLLVNLQASSIYRGAWTFSEIRLAAPRVHLVIEKNGGVNLAALAAPSTTPADKKAEKTAVAIPAVAIHLLEINRATIDFRDVAGARPFGMVVSPIAFSLKDFSTEPTRLNPFSLDAVFGDGTRLVWHGHFSTGPVAAHGDLDIDNLVLRTWWTYLQDALPFELTEGLLDLSLAYALEFSPGTFQADLSKIRMNLEKLAMGEKGAPVSLITLSSATLDESCFDWQSRKIELGPVKLDSLWADAKRGADGSINLQPLFAGSPRKPEPAAPAKATADDADAWQIILPEIVLENSDILFEDRTCEPPATVRLHPLKGTAAGFKLMPGATIEVTASSGINETGILELSGTLGISPFTMEMAVGLEKMALAPFAPYLKPVARIALEDGSVGVKGRLQYQTADASAPAFLFEGDAGIWDLALADPVHDEIVLGWNSLKLKDVIVHSKPDKFEIGLIDFDRPQVLMALFPEGGSTLTALFSPKENTAAESVSPETEAHAAEPPRAPVSIGRIQVENGAISFADRSISPHFVTGVQELNGSVEGISAGAMTRAVVDLKGKANGLAPVTVKGKINFPGDADGVNLEMVAGNIEMTRMTPYLGKYVGNVVQKGKLFLDLKYTVADKHLKGENSILLDQFTLGDKTDSPDATTLPVRLAIALLKDRNGKIDINLPVQGDLSDPEFSYGGLILKAIVNLIVKAAASPFSLLGKIVGGDGEALQMVAFDFGLADMPAAQQEKLGKIATILTNRPGLGLEIQGCVDSDKDRRQLAEMKLAAMLNKMKNKESPGAVALTLEEEKTLLQKAYLKKFPEVKPIADKAPEEIIQIQKEQLLSAMGVTDDELRVLAHDRALKIKNYLVNEGKIPNDRLFLVDIQLASTPAAESANTMLSLVGK